MYWHGGREIVNFDLASAAGSRAVIVVEGMSDRVALETLAVVLRLALAGGGAFEARQVGQRFRCRLVPGAI